MTGPPYPRRSELAAILLLRCPRCREGRIFQRGTIMNPRCPFCSLEFDREPGYFLGAMYFSYMLAGTFLVTAYFVGSMVLPGFSRELVAGVAVLIFIPLVPTAFRYSRVLWIHYDRWAWPGQDYEAWKPESPKIDTQRNGHSHDSPTGKHP